MINRKKAFSLALVLALTVPMAVACTKGKTTDDKTERVLRIASLNYYGEDDSGFRQQYSQVFEYTNPNIKIEMVQLQDPYQYMYQSSNGKEPAEQRKDPFDTLKELMEQPNPPDIVMVGYDQLPELVSSNLLAPLDPRITKDKFDTTGIVPAVIDGLKAAGEGKLYALAPTFSASALIYNKKLFDEAGVEYPKDNMTWDDVFNLARRLTRGEDEQRKYGFAFNSQSQDIFYGMQAYTIPLELRMMDDNGEKMQVDSDNWEKVWKTMQGLQNEKIMPPPPDYSKPRVFEPDKQGPFTYDDFMSGRLAMTIFNYGQLSQLINANKNAANIKGYEKIDYDFVTMPSHPENPGVVPYIYMNGVMGINAKAGNPDDAWKFIKFVNGEDWAKLRSSNSYEMISRKSYIKPKTGENYRVEAFYNVKPAPFTNEFAKFRNKNNIYMVQQFGQTEFQQAMSGQKTIRDALKSWQTSGDALLQKIKENPNGPIDMGQFQGGSAMAMPIMK